MSKYNYKRRKYIVDPDFQYGVIRKVAFLAVLIILMSFSFMTIVYYRYGDVRVEITQPDPFKTSNTVSAMKEPKSLTRLLLPVLAICLSITLIATFLFGLLISNRMAGPVYRMRRALSEMAQGNLSINLRLRKNDAFKSLASEINNLCEKWHVLVIELRGIGEMILKDENDQKEYYKLLTEMLADFKMEITEKN